MDRKLVYPGQIPLSAQILQSEQNTLVGLAYLAQAVFGTATIVDGLACTPTAPTSLTVTVGAGSIYELEPLDALGYGTLAADIHNIIKQGINKDAQAITLVPPGTSGQAVNVLIQATIVEADADYTVLPYVNSQNPAQPFTGPNNSGASQPTTRKLTIQISAKYGTAATAGTQVTPSPDAGYVGLYYVTVAYGATTLDTTAITQLDTAPFLFKKLPDLPQWIQSGQFLYGDDTGTANAMVVNNLSPKPSSYYKGMHLFIKKSAAANSANLTVNVKGQNGVMLGAMAVLDSTGAQIGSGNATGSLFMHLCCDGSAFRWVNGNITNTTISSITATSGEGVNVGGTTPFPVSLNFPGLTSGAPTPLDLFAFYDHEGAHHQSISWASLLAQITSGLATGLLNIQVFTASGVYTPTAGARQALVFAQAGGGGGGGCPVTQVGAGAGGGGAAIKFLSLSGVSTVAVTVALGGLAGTTGNGGDGGNSSFGAYAVATGGKGGDGGSNHQKNGGSGGYATAGDILIAGCAGIGPMGSPAGDYYGGGPGGGCFLGGGATTNNGNTGNGNGIDAQGFGGGGSGGDGYSAQSNGGKGAPGLVFVLEFA